MQILIALNRREPKAWTRCKAEIALARCQVTATWRAQSIIPRHYARVCRSQSWQPGVVEQALGELPDQYRQPAPAAWTTVGRMRLAAGRHSPVRWKPPGAARP
jgi:hypothetical protein